MKTRASATRKAKGGLPTPTEAPQVTGEAPVGHDGPTEKVRAALQAEIDRLQVEYDRLEAQLPKLEHDYDMARKEACNAIDSPAADRCSDSVIKVLTQQMTIMEKMDLLRNPAELERRMQDAGVKTQRIERIKTMAATVASKKQSARDMGTPDVYLAENGNFKPGLDARFKSDLVHSYLGLKSKKALRTFTKDEAESFLQARSWMGFVSQKREALERQEAKAAKAKERKTRAKPARAEPVELVETATIAEQVADQVAAIFVTPDPKPTRKPRSDKGKPRSRKIRS
jgi:hypothetical protein